MFVEPTGTIDPDVVGIDDDEDFYTVIAFDPGGTTGWCLIGVHPDSIKDRQYRIVDNIVFWSVGEYIGDEDQQTEMMLELVDAWPLAKVVIEDFVLRKFSSARELLSPVRITAKFEYGMKIHRKRPFIIQPGKLAMDAVTDARIKRMGMWPPLSGGEDHKRDAFRHAMTWLKRAKKLHERNMITSALSAG